MPLYSSTAAQAIVITLPWARSGTSQVVTRQIGHLRQLGYRTVLAVVASHYDGGFDAAEWAEFAAYCAEYGADEVLLCRYEKPGLTQIIARLITYVVCKGDAMDWALVPAHLTPLTLLRPLLQAPTPLILANHVYVMPFALKVKQALQDRGQNPRLLAVSHDVQSHILIDREAKAPWSFAIEPEDRLLTTECRWLSQADGLVHLSDDDHRFFQARIAHKPHRLILPDIPPLLIGTGAAKKRDLLFIGKDHPGNVHSLRWYVDRVVPHFRQPPRLTVAGHVADVVRGWFPGAVPDWLDLLGPVSDLARLYAEVRLVAAPIVRGRGISIKTVEAFAAGLPVVGTSVAYRGIPALAASGLKTFDSPQDFAREVERLLQSPEARERVAAQGSALYQCLFRPDHALKAFADFLTELKVHPNPVSGRAFNP